ncbi:MAG: polyphenol oxidase family protein [Acidobacteriota bacterium]|nr:polyphenol oxidase family protein [Acidobacteriota bacterium]
MELPSPFREQDGQIAIDLPGAHVVFTTRSWGDVRETQTEIAQRLGLRIVRPRQVHGDKVIAVAEAQADQRHEADALVTATPGLAPMVITADCLPIVIATPGAVAVVHAGWRGLDQGLIGSAVDALRVLSAGVMTAAIGPGAGVCCYEVGDDLHRRFKTRCQDFRRGDNLDLKAIARVQLMEAGVARIHDAAICTICGDPALTFSHRREGAQTGRQAALAWLS